jgi:hypothetical protein
MFGNDLLATMSYIMTPAEDSRLCDELGTLLTELGQPAHGRTKSEILGTLRGIDQRYGDSTEISERARQLRIQIDQVLKQMP